MLGMRLRIYFRQFSMMFDRMVVITARITVIMIALFCFHVKHSST